MTETTKAIIFLGVKPIDTNYVFPDGREYIAPFFGIALANFVPGLRMRVFVTATTKKESLPTLQCAVAKFVTDIQSVDFIKVYLDFRNTSCVLTEFGSYAARNMFP
jgi:hypothetical protein